jgi:hypothetical protein
LGYNNANEVKDHPWLADVNWKEMMEKTIPSPFVPRSGDNFDKRYCEGIDKIGSETHERYQSYFQKENYSNLFPSYTFYGELIQKEKNRLRSGYKAGGIDSYITKSSRTGSSSSLNVKKKTLSYNSVNSSLSNSNISMLKVSSHSPIPVKDKKTTNTPILKSRQATNRSLLNSASSLLKIYSNTPLKYQDSNSKIIDRLPNIVDLTKVKSSSNNNIKISGGAIIGPSLNVFKKSNRTSTLSMDTSSTNNTLMHKRTSSNFNKKSIK